MGKPKKLTNPYDRYRSQAYDAVLARNGRRVPDLEEVIDEVLRLASVVDVEDLKRSAAAQAVQTEDSLRTSSRGGSLQLMLEGWPDPPSRIWRLGESARVEVEAATADDHSLRLEFIEQNETRVVDEARAARVRHRRLLPYYTAGIQMVKAAVEAYHHDHPDAAAATP